MKKIISLILLSTMLVFCLSACGAKEYEQTNSKKNDSAVSSEPKVSSEPTSSADSEGDSTVTRL